MKIDEEHIENLTDGQRDNAVLENSLSDRGDGSMEIDNACLAQLIDVVRLGDSEHKVAKPKQTHFAIPKRKHFKKKKSPGKT